MGSSRTNKVCLELLGKPVICRAVQSLINAGIKSHTVVIGACAGEVMACLNGQFRNIAYACQYQQRGVADAVACAVRSLPESLDDDTLLLIVPGHRIIAPEIIEQLLDFYRKNNLKLAGLKLPENAPGIPRQILSIYLGKFSDISEGLAKLAGTHPENSREVTLADLAAAMNGSNSECMLEVDDFSQVLGFNNPEEFLLVADILHRRQCSMEYSLAEEEYHTISEWQNAMQSGKLRAVLDTVYGGVQPLVNERVCAVEKLLEAAAGKWTPDSRVTIIRSPGRVNVMGRHVDHQGGNCNLMTIGYETLIAARVRNDDKVTLCNLQPEFPPAEFSIGDLVRDLPWDDWKELVGSKKLARLLKQYGVNWADYIKAVFLRFQKHFDSKKLHGMDMIVSGNVPMAAGLSSSSTLVVGGAEAVVGANRLDLEPDKLVTLCGEGEWFVGTRGGAADHAAVKLGKCNKVVKVGFFDFKVEEMVDFPADYTLIVGDSGIKARKSSNAKDQFNHRVSCYRIGLMLLKKYFPQYAAELHHLRDFNCRNLNIPLKWFYELLLKLPEYAVRSELEKMLPGEDLQMFWSNHNVPPDGVYPIRGVVLFGLAECERSARYVWCLQNNIAEVGEMMNISHNGDRVMQFDADGGNPREYFFDTSDAALMRLSHAAQAGEPAAQLWRQPGSYRCSLPEIDLMIDLANSVPGVLGSQLAGAGLGGCMMVLAHKDAVEPLTCLLTEKYYVPRNLEPGLLLCRPIAGAGAIRWL